MGAYGIGAELTGDAASGYSIFKITQDNPSAWSDLREP